MTPALLKQAREALEIEREIFKRIVDKSDCVRALCALAHYIRSLSSPAPVEGGPDWTCSDCGHSGSDFRTITYSSTDGTDYDLECPSCGSLEVEESIDQAIHRMAEKLEDARVRLSRLERVEKGESK